MYLINKTNNVRIVDYLEIADTPWLRMKGLLGRNCLAKGSGLLITHCNSIHMMFMRFPLDAIFVDSLDSVVGLVRNIPPFAFSPIFWNATKVIEVNVGTIDQTGIQLGDKVCSVDF